MEKSNALNISVSSLNSKYKELLDKYKVEVKSLENEISKNDEMENETFDFNILNKTNKDDNIDININLKKKINLLKTNISSSNPLLGLEVNDEIYDRIQFKLINQAKTNYLNSKLFHDINETKLNKKRRHSFFVYNPFKDLIDKNELLVDKEIHENIIKAKGLNLVEKSNNPNYNSQNDDYNHSIEKLYNSNNNFLLKSDVENLNEVISDFLLLTSKMFHKSVYIMISTVLSQFRNCYVLLKDKIKLEIDMEIKSSMNKKLNYEQSNHDNNDNFNFTNFNEIDKNISLKNTKNYKNTKQSLSNETNKSICTNLNFIKLNAKFVNFFLSDYSCLKLPSVDYLVIMIITSYFLDWCYLMRFTDFKMII